MEPSVFISHSSKDKPFVRKLDSALSSSGVKVFLDEREIKIGDSIPDAIYGALSDSTHVIYVVSSNSVESEWVREELSIAKMRQKENSGLKILPILLEDIMLPTAVQHIKYSSFVNWQSSNVFISSMNEIYESLGVSLKYSENKEIAFYFKYMQEYSEVERSTAELGAVIETALCTHSCNNSPSEHPHEQWLVKYMLQDIPISKIEEFVEVANNYAKWKEETRMCIIIDLINEFLCQLQYSVDKPSTYRIPCDRFGATNQLLNRICGVMESLRLDVTSIVGSNCKI